MFLDFLEKREETTDSITLTDEEKIFLKVFGIDSEQPAAAMREATYFTCIKQLSEAVAKTPLYLVQDTENGIRRATEERLNELLSLRPNPYMTAIRRLATLLRLLDMRQTRNMQTNLLRLSSSISLQSLTARQRARRTKEREQPGRMPKSTTGYRLGLTEEKKALTLWRSRLRRPDIRTYS